MMGESLETEIAVIGGGIVGTSAAYHIAQRGHRVILLEKDFVGSKASGVNFGGVRTNGRVEAELSLSLRSKAIWHRFDEFVGQWCDYRMTGHLEVAHCQEDLAVIEKWAEMARSHGIEPQLLGPNELRVRYPWMSSKMVGGCLVADDGCANPRLVMPNIALAARKMGATIMEHCGVTAAEVHTAGFTLHTSTGHKIRARKVINATGGYAGRVSELFGETFPVEPIAPQMMISEPIGIKIEPVLDYCLAGRFLYFRQVERGNILFGRGSGEVDLDRDYTSYLPVNMFNGAAVATRLIPDLHGINIIRSWSGIDGAMPDSVPVLDFSETVADLIQGFGFSGHGFQLGPASGAVLAELAIDGKTDTDISAFKAARFS